MHLVVKVVGGSAYKAVMSDGTPPPWPVVVYDYDFYDVDPDEIVQDEDGNLMATYEVEA